MGQGQHSRQTLLDGTDDGGGISEPSSTRLRTPRATPLSACDPQADPSKVVCINEGAPVSVQNLMVDPNKPLKYVHRSAELQIRLGEAAERGQGYGTEVVRLLLDFAFKDLNLHRVYLHVFSTNTAVIRVYEKVGFVREGLLRKAAHINGAYVDVLVMGILREEYVG